MTMKMAKGNVQARFHLLGVTLLLAACVMAFVATADGATEYLPVGIFDNHTRKMDNTFDEVQKSLEEIKNEVGNSHTGHSWQGPIIAMLAFAVIVLIFTNCYFCYFVHKNRSAQASIYSSAGVNF